LGGIRGGKDHRCCVSFAGLADGAQPVDGAGDGELRCPESLDHVPASTPAGLLHRPKHLIDAGKSTSDALGVQCPSGEDPVALEERLGAGIRPAGRVGLGC
jgi:hypothetical protein